MYLFWPQHFEIRNQLQGEITSKKRTKNMLLKNTWVNDEIKQEIRKYLKTDDYEKILGHLWDAAKAVLREKVIMIQVFLKK